MQFFGDEAVFGWLYFWPMPMLICCERKTLFHGWLIWLISSSKQRVPLLGLFVCFSFGVVLACFTFFNCPFALL
jgi:hypothetical protein